MIIIEGLDGVGKTTLVDYFVNMGMKNIILIMMLKIWICLQNICEY